MSEAQRSDEASTLPAWSRHIPPRYWPIVPQLHHHYTGVNESVLLAQWVSIETHVKQLEVLDALEHRELIENQRLKAGFEKFCFNTAAEQTRSQRRALLATATVAFLSGCTFVALGSVLVTVVGGVAGLNDWIVAAACLLALTILDFTLRRRQTRILGAVCTGLVLLSAGPVLVADPRTAGHTDLLLGHLAEDGTGLALGVFLAAIAAAVIIKSRAILLLALDRAERLRHRNVVPDVKAFEQFHSIVRDMLDKDLVLAGPARVALANRIADAAVQVKALANLYAGLDGLAHQQRELKRRLQSLADYLQQDTHVLVSTTASDVDLLTSCLTCLVAISLGHAGRFPEATGVPRVPTRPGRFELAKLRVFAWASMTLLGVVTTAVTHLDVSPAMAITATALLVLLAALAPERWLRRVDDFGFWSRVAGWLGSNAQRRPTDNKPQGDQR